MSMHSCIRDVKASATQNMLTFDNNNTVLMLATSKRIMHFHSLSTSTSFGAAQFPFKQSMKNLGFTLSCHLTMREYFSTFALTCYVELCCLASIRNFLSSTKTTILVSAFVSLKIDYCSSLLFGSTHDVTYNLQEPQDCAARVILRIPTSNITTHIKSYHWLPVKVRSTYKIAWLCYVAAVLNHHMSLICCTKSRHNPATLAPAHTPCVFSIDLHTVRQHLVIAHFILLLSGTLIQMIFAVPNHCHHLCLV